MKNVKLKIKKSGRGLPGGAFSLTLTLSRWERGQPLDALLKFARLRAAGSLGFAKVPGTMVLC
jgi:hypothetical protein